VSFEENQEGLAAILQKVGTNIENYLKFLPNTASTEQVRQERGSRVASKKYQYVILANPGNETELTEYRTDSKGNPLELGGLKEGFFLTARFATVPLLLHPLFQPGSRFRYLGTASDPLAHVIAFAQVPEFASVRSEYEPVPGPKVALYDQGLIWVDPASYQIIRIYKELLEPRTDVGLQKVTSDITFQRVSFKHGDLSFWLPSEVKS